MNALLETPEILDTPETETPAALADLKAEWLGHFDKAISSTEGLAQIAVSPREPIVGGWFKQGDLGFIYGARGLGKTWLAMLLARKCVEGGSVADWNVHKPRRVLYIDGEMPLDGIRERDAALSTVAADVRGVLLRLRGQKSGVKLWDMRSIENWIRGEMQKS